MKPEPRDSEKRPILLLDVNETLLDLRSLDPLFEDVFGDRSLRSIWFSQMLQLSFVGIITSQYLDFSTAQRSALRMLGERRGHELDGDDLDKIVGAMSKLSPYPDVQPALVRLVNHGFRLAALTNSPEPVVDDQLNNARIRSFFECVLSADKVRRLKPAPEPYLMAAKVFGVSTADTCLIAAHPWDISGALAAGCQAAFVARPGMVLSPVGPQPAFVGRDLGEIAGLLMSESQGQ